MPTYYSHEPTKESFIKRVKGDASKVMITAKDDYDPIYGSVERVLMQRGRITVRCWSEAWSATVKFRGRNIAIL